MTVCHNGVNHMLRVRPGPEGKLEFEQQIIKIFGLQANDIVEFTFGCKAPGTGLLSCPSSVATANSGSASHPQ